VPYRFDFVLGSLQPLFGAGQGFLFVDAGRLMVADAAARHCLLEFDAGCGDALPTAADLVVPVVVAIVMDPLQGTADFHVEAFQGRGGIVAENVDRGGHFLDGIDSRESGLAHVACLLRTFYTTQSSGCDVCDVRTPVVREVLSLLQVLVDDFGLAVQIRNMMFDDLYEAGHGPHVLLELLGEFLLFLIAPGAFQGRHLGSQRGDAVLDLAAELLQILGEPPQFFGVDNGLRHEIPPSRP
jgi:hypothetical protein